MFDFLLANLLPMKVGVPHEQDVGHEIRSFFRKQLSGCWEGLPQRMEGARCIACIHTCVNLLFIVICSLQFFDACTMFT